MGHPSLSALKEHKVWVSSSDADSCSARISQVQTGKEINQGLDLPVPMCRL